MANLQSTIAFWEEPLKCLDLLLERQYNIHHITYLWTMETFEKVTQTIHWRIICHSNCRHSKRAGRVYESWRKNCEGQAFESSQWLLLNKLVLKWDTNFMPRGASLQNKSFWFVSSFCNIENYFHLSLLSHFFTSFSFCLLPLTLGCTKS